MGGRPRQQHPSREAVVAAALTCFTRSGYDQATMREVAAEAGTSVAQIYLSFKNKNSLGLAVITQQNELMIYEYLRPAMDSDLAGFERLMAVAEAYKQFYLDHRKAAVLMHAIALDPDPTDPAAQRLAQIQGEQLARLGAMLGELAEETGADINPVHFYRFIWAAMNGVALINDRVPHLAASDEETDRVVGVGLRMMRAGLREAGRIR
jgi:AcrR family transcriptional regulator